MLKSAHLTGRARAQIINRLLSAIYTESVITVDLAHSEKNFRLEHEPVEQAILILCRECHTKYDTAIHSAAPGTGDIGAVAGDSGFVSVTESPDRILPITLEPPKSTEFKRQRLASRRAQITTLYNNGLVAHQPWDASRFSEASSVMGNLRSRTEFKAGAWRQSSIVQVHVRIVDQEG